MKHDFPDRSPDSDYHVKTKPDQTALSNALTTFKMSKATLGLTKDITAKFEKTLMFWGNQFVKN